MGLRNLNQASNETGRCFKDKAWIRLGSVHMGQLIGVCIAAMRFSDGFMMDVDVIKGFHDD